MPASNLTEVSAAAAANAAAAELPAVLRLIQDGQHESLAVPSITGEDGREYPALTHIAGSTPLVFDSPHSGTVYPADFGTVCPRAVLRQAEDTHVDALYRFAPAMGVHWVEAHFPRSYLDANRDCTEIDVTMLAGNAWTGPIATDERILQKVRLGKGLIWKCTDEGQPLYDRALSAQEVERRIAHCWQPYHERVADAIDAAHAAHGWSIHLNCHSMPAVAATFATLHPGLVHADFVVGDRDGTTADEKLSRALVDFLKNLGYSVEYNHPYKGVELVRRHSAPAQNRHSIQLEVNRKLYMNEATLQIKAEGFTQLQRDLQKMTQWLLQWRPENQ